MYNTTLQSNLFLKLILNKCLIKGSDFMQPLFVMVVSGTFCQWDFLSVGLGILERRREDGCVLKRKSVRSLMATCDRTSFLLIAGHMDYLAPGGNHSASLNSYLLEVDTKYGGNER